MSVADIGSIIVYMVCFPYYLSSAMLNLTLGQMVGVGKVILWP